MRSVQKLNVPFTRTPPNSSPGLQLSMTATSVTIPTATSNWAEPEQDVSPSTDVAVIMTV